MKKIIIFSIIISFTVPTLVSASWWNPTSWFKNNTTPKQDEYRNQELLTKIQELESRIKIYNEIATSTINNSTSISTSTYTQKPSIINKIVEVDNPVLKAKIVSLTAQLQDSINNNSVLSNKLMQVQTNLNICESKITVPTINDNIQNGNVESLRKVNAKIAELQGILTQIGLIISTDSLSDIKATLKETYDIYGSHIFSNEVLVGISGTGSWKLPIKKVIESQLTSLKVLQAQYQSY